MIALSASTWAGDGSQMGRMKADREGQGSQDIPCNLSFAQPPTLPRLATLVCVCGDYPPLSELSRVAVGVSARRSASVLAKTGVQYSKGASREG